MKTKLPFIAIVAILVSACTTGTYMAKTYDDDIYFSPADVPPVTLDQDRQQTLKKAEGNERIVMSQMEKNTDGSSTLNNYIYQPDEETQNSDYQAYDMDQQELMGSDTTVYYNDDDVKYVINNYYDDNDYDIGFAYRINRFHRPYYYSPFFYDDWYYGYNSPFYSGYYGWGGSWGWDPWYSGGWGYPYSYYGYYSPFSFGYSGYWGGGYGGYYSSYYGGYYNGYYNGYYGTGGGFYNNHQVARRRSTEMNVPGNSNNQYSTGNRTSGLKGGLQGNSSDAKLPTGINNNTWVQNGHTRTRTGNTSGVDQDTKNATIVNTNKTSFEGRRTGTASGTQIQNENGTRTQVARPATGTQGNVRRTYQPSTTGRTYDQAGSVRQSQNYTPSYNKPRIVNQSNYNSNSSNYNRPRTSESGTVRETIKSANTGSQQNYSAPRSSSSVRQTYRSSSTYSSGSSSTPSRSSSTYSSPSYSAPASSGNSSPSYSAPARSYSAPASSGSSSGSSSSGSSSGGSSSGGGSGHRR